MSKCSYLPARVISWCAQSSSISPRFTRGGGVIHYQITVGRVVRWLPLPWVDGKCFPLTLSCPGSVACTVIAIFGAARESSFVREIPRPDLGLDPEALADLPYIPDVAPAFLQHMQVRMARGTPPGTGHHEPRTIIYARVREPDCTAEEALIALADVIPTPALSMLSKHAPASSLNWTLELLGDPAQLDVGDWSLIDTEVRAGIDGYLSQTSVLWGATGHAFSVSHQSVAIFG